jgi:fucose permease
VSGSPRTYRYALYLLVFTTGVSFSLIGAALPDIIARYDLTRTEASVLPFLQFLGTYGGLVFVAFAPSRVRLLLAGASFVQCLAAFYLLLVPGYDVFFKTAFFLFGSAGNVIVPLTGMIVTQANRSGSGRELNIHYGFFSAGVTVAPLYAGLLFNSGLHYGAAYLGLACLGGAGFLWMLWCALPVGLSGERLSGETLMSGFARHGRFLAVLLTVNFFYVVAESIPNTWIPKYFTDLFPLYAPFRTSLVLSLFWGFVTVGRSVCAALLHRGVKPVSLMMLLAGLGGAWVFFGAAVKNRLAAEILFSTSGLFFSGMFPILASSFGRLPERFTGMGFVILIATGMLGASGSSRLAGFVADRIGFRFSMMMATISLLGALAVLALRGRVLEEPQDGLDQDAPPSFPR